MGGFVALRDSHQAGLDLAHHPLQPRLRRGHRLGDHLGVVVDRLGPRGPSVQLGHLARHRVQHLDQVLGRTRRLLVEQCGGQRPPVQLAQHQQVVRCRGGDLGGRHPGVEQQVVSLLHPVEESFAQDLDEELHLPARRLHGGPQHRPATRPVTDHLELHLLRRDRHRQDPVLGEQGRHVLGVRGPDQPRQLRVARVEPHRDLAVAVGEDHRPFVTGGPPAGPGAHPEEFLAPPERPVDHGRVRGGGGALGVGVHVVEFPGDEGAPTVADGGHQQLADGIGGQELRAVVVLDWCLHIILALSRVMRRRSQSCRDRVVRGPEIEHVVSGRQPRGSSPTLR